jgi:predicted transposase/invertase (TIGR01784 family)
LELSATQKRLFERESVSKIFPEHYILKVNMFNDIARDSLDEWIYFLKNSEIKDEFRAKGLAEAREKLRMINLSKKELRAYQRHLEDLHMAASLEEQFRFEQAQAREQGEKIGMEKGEKVGMEQGEKIGINKTALNMINHGMSIDDVVKITGLNSEDIKEIMETKVE